MSKKIFHINIIVEVKEDCVGRFIEEGNKFIQSSLEQDFEDEVRIIKCSFFEQFEDGK